VVAVEQCRGQQPGRPPTTPTTPNPPPAANGRAALAASGYAGAGAQVRFGETYELANDQSLRGTPTSSGMSYAMVSKTPMQINFTSATMLTLDSQGQQYSLFDGDGDSVFEPISGGHPKVVAVIVEKEAAQVMAIELTGAGQVDTTYSAIGPNTDPTAMPASGSALYNGTVNAVPAALNQPLHAGQRIFWRWKLSCGFHSKHSLRIHGLHPIQRYAVHPRIKHLNSHPAQHLHHRKHL
jgi:hypothetical protein